MDADSCWQCGEAEVAGVLVINGERRGICVWCGMNWYAATRQRFQPIGEVP